MEKEKERMKFFFFGIFFWTPEPKGANGFIAAGAMSSNAPFGVGKKESLSCRACFFLENHRIKINLVSKYSPH
jgi:hypothetical protein